MLVVSLSWRFLQLFKDLAPLANALSKADGRIYGPAYKMQCERCLSPV